MGPPAKRQITIEAAMKGKFDQCKARQLWINIFMEGIAPIWLTESPAMREFLAYIAPNFRVPSIVEVEEALRDADAAIQLDLPKSIRCCARMLNVMATTDIREVRFFNYFFYRKKVIFKCPQQFYTSISFISLGYEVINELNLN